PIRNGSLILPTGIREYLRTRGVHWPCFCALLLGNGATCSSRIVHSRDTGEVFAFCGRKSSGFDCGFFMNLSKTFHTVTLLSGYNNYPTLASQRAPDMELLACVHRLETATDDEIGEYFEGYLGEHITTFPGVEQLAGEQVSHTPPNFKRRGLSANTLLALLTPDPVAEERREARRRQALDRNYMPYVPPIVAKSPAATRIRRRQNPLPLLGVPIPAPSLSSAPIPAPSLSSVPIPAPPLSSVHPSTSTSASSMHPPTPSSASSEASPTSKGKSKARDPHEGEDDILRRLRSGEGVRLDDFERCPVCNKIFLRSTFKAHQGYCIDLTLLDD
ncbi:hypothetical protein H0H93_004721, partial [Arthromyces matolae]